MMQADGSVPSPFTRTALLILWPAFFVAGVQEALVFVVVDPRSLHWFGATLIDWPMQAVYTVTFLIFWATTATAGALTQLLREPPAPQPSLPQDA